MPQLLFAVLFQALICTHVYAQDGIRLVGGTSSKGRVEVLHNGVWGSVCDDWWDYNEAAVACRMLGYSQAIDKTCCSSFGSADEDAPIWIDNSNCRGDESTLFSCAANERGVHNCRHYEDAGVVCDPNSYVGTSPTTQPPTTQPPTTQPPTTQPPTTQPSTTQPPTTQPPTTQLPTTQPPTTQPPTTQPPAPTTQPPTAPPFPVVSAGQLQYRLHCPQNPGGSCRACEDTPASHTSCASRPAVQGFVQAQYNGVWYNLDNDEWNVNTAHVFCGQLGYPAAFAGPSYFDLLGCVGCRDIGLPMPYDFRCFGSEENIASCPFQRWSSQRFVSDFATVQCGYPPAQTCGSGNIEVRLSHSPYPGTGQVEVKTPGGSWGSLCSADFTQNSANVICRQLGFGSADAFHITSKYGEGHASIALSSLQCPPGAVAISQCTSSSSVGQCSHSQDVAVECHLPEPCPLPDIVRFYGSGYVEVDMNGVWGVVCSDQFTRVQGQVICRGLRKQFLKAFSVRRAVYSGPRYHGHLLCNGNERNPSDCSIQFNAVSSCSAGEVFVECGLELPDLVPDALQLQRSIEAAGAIRQQTLGQLRCAIEEGCMASDAARVVLTNPGQVRRLLTFDSLVSNYGKADFRPFLTPEQWEYHSCHRHYHSHEEFASYELYTTAGQEASEGHKASFCLEDSFCPRGTETFKCYRGTQGVSVGCGDLYARSLDCQWLDITHVPDGSYTLRIHVNSANKPEESEYRNNVVNCGIFISGISVSVTSCKIDGY